MTGDPQRQCLTPFIKFAATSIATAFVMISLSAAIVFVIGVVG